MPWRSLHSKLARDYLDAQCGDELALRAEVEELLRHHEQFAPVGDSASVTNTTPPPAKLPGTQIGPFKLLQQIGEGGMSMVYMAEQSEPIVRRVALKIIKPGMGSRQVIARFEAERQALAMMDHVNIARVLDAGATESGRPYFVMELVHGVPITKYCDDNRLTPRQRSGAFASAADQSPDTVNGFARPWPRGGWRRGAAPSAAPVPGRFLDQLHSRVGASPVGSPLPRRGHLLLQSGNSGSSAERRRPHQPWHCLAYTRITG